jgi:hypothetical protein
VRRWLRRWLGISGLETDYRASLAKTPHQDPARVAIIEAAIVEMRETLSGEIAELRERLEMPKRKAPSGRPFTVLRSLAEEGARRAAEKAHAR